MGEQRRRWTWGTAVVAGLCLALGGGAQAVEATGAVEGRVTAVRSGAPVAGAEVSEQPQGLQATTDATGRFRLAGLRPGPHRLRVRATGFGAVAQTVEVKAGATAAVQLALPAIRTRPVAARDDALPVKTTETKAKARRDKAARSGSASFGYGGAMGHGRGGGGVGYGKVHVAYGSAPAARPAYAPPARELDREGYDPIDEQSFHAVGDQPLSTLSIDVDTAAYSNVRRFVARGQLPPKDAVRIEELLNYFPYAYAGPQDDAPFAVHTEVSVAPWNPAHRLARIGIQGRRIDAQALPPCNLVFLVDVSGSMSAPDKLPLVQRSLALLAQELRPQDRVAIVVYAGAAGLVLPPTSGADKAAIVAAIGELQAGGSTAGGAGIALAYAVAQQAFIQGGSNRVILATDGDFNIGVSSDGELVRLIEDKRKSGVFLTVLGYGTGNYQDAKMQKLADAGNGHHAYIDTLFEAHKVLVQEMGATLLTLAKDVKVQVEFNPAFVKGYRLIGYENRLLAARDFNDDKKDAGELGAGHAVTALYEIVPAGSPEPLAGADRLKYQQANLAPGAVKSGELMTVKLRYKAPQADTSRLIERPVRDDMTPLQGTSADFRFAAAVAAYGLVLRSSPFKGTATFAGALELARGALGADQGGHRRAFVGLIEKTAAVTRVP